ncbi:MAG: hypothetical protein KatS3mg026_1200 [Bacteroidia bacterium]|nr:MAG: hypothetical protein KatS3mg026_1200 [Bacteroidia bacterium]
MATWRTWLKSLLPWTEKEENPSPAPASDTTPAQGPAAAPPAPTIPFLSEPIRLAPLKEWTQRFISPYAWDRAVIRVLPLLREERIPLPEVLNPTPTTHLPPKLIQNLLLALQEMYGTVPPVAVLNGEKSASKP